jgi:hypothetical protein
LFPGPLSATIPDMNKQRKPRMGRPTKSARDKRSRTYCFSVEPPRAAVYKRVAKAHFKGVISDFLRAAADALADQLERDTPAAERKP